MLAIKSFKSFENKQCLKDLMIMIMRPSRNYQAQKFIVISLHIGGSMVDTDDSLITVVP